MIHFIRKFSIQVLFVIAAISIAATSAFAGEPIPGVGVAAGKNPGGRIIAKVTTDAKGNFVLQLDTGSYTITFTAADVKNMMAIASKKYGKKYAATQGAVLTLQPSSGLKVNGKSFSSAIVIPLSSTNTTRSPIAVASPMAARLCIVRGTITTADPTK